LQLAAAGPKYTIICFVPAAASGPREKVTFCAAGQLQVQLSNLQQATTCVVYIFANKYAFSLSLLHLAPTIHIPFACVCVFEQLTYLLLDGSQSIFST
jgi:hypothetical protein